MSAALDCLHAALEAADRRIDALLHQVEGLLAESPSPEERARLDRDLVRAQHERDRLQREVDRQAATDVQALVAFGIGAALGVGFS